MAPSLREKKASRITTACNPCRSRKQKCSGDRPVCTQCLEYNRVCAWPEQLKRGPAKGYIEALEHRLQETESVLLKILPHLSHSQLSSIIVDNGSSISTTENGAIVYTPISPMRKRGAEYWKSFPLSTVENIRKWQQDCLTNKNSSPNGKRDTSSEKSISSLSRQRALETPNSSGLASPAEGSCSRSHGSDSQVDLYSQPAEDTISLPVPLTTPVTHHMIRQEQGRLSERPLDVEIADGDGASSYHIFDHSNQSQLNFLKGNYMSSTPHDLNSWEAVPGIKFEQQFLW